MKLLYTWRMVGRYADQTEIEVGGMDEEDCMWRLCNLIKEHGNLEWYSGVCDEDYVDGEYIGRENFIYD